MNRRSWRPSTGFRVCLVVAVATVMVSLVAAPALAGVDVSLWEMARRLGETFTGWGMATLDGAVLQGARADLRDLRVVDEDKQEIPWREVTGQAPWSPVSGTGGAGTAGTVVTYTVRILDLSSDAASGTTTFVADLGRDKLITNSLNLTTTSRDFFKRLTFEASSDLKTWKKLRAVDYVYDLTAKGGGRSLRVSYPDMTSRFLRVTIDDYGTTPLASLGAEPRYRKAPADLEPVPSEVVQQGQTGNDTWVVLDLSYSGVTVTELSVSLPGIFARRPVKLEGSGDGEHWTEVLWSLVYEGMPGGPSVEGVTGGEVVAEAPGPPGEGPGWVRLELPRTAYRFYRFSVVSGQDPPVTPEGFVFRGVPRRIIFHSETGKQLYLLYGNTGAPAPVYDAAFFAGLGPTTTFAPVTLGRELSVLTEPEAAATPPKSDVDPKTWRFERTLLLIGLAGEDGKDETPAAAGGYVQAALPPDVLDGARADLGDLRIVDGTGAQVPFRVFTDRSRAAGAWPFVIAGAGVDKNLPRPRTWWVLDLRYRNLPVQCLAMVAPASANNFRRDVTVSGSNDGEAWQNIAVGQIRRFATIFGAEENLTLALPASTYRYLRLAVDEAPPGLTPAEVKGFPSSILWRWEVGREYRLFWGNSAATARDYGATGLASASPFLTPRLASEAFGPVTDHSPPPTPPSFLTPGEGEPVTGPANRWVGYALWGLLGLVVVGAGFLIVRVFRALGEERKKGGKEGPAGDTAGSPPRNAA